MADEDARTKSRGPKPPPLPKRAAPPAPSKSEEEISCGVCGTRAGARERYCDACGFDLHPTPLKLAMPSSLAAVSFAVNAEEESDEDGDGSKIICSDCATPNAARFRYCNWCGFPLKADAVAASSVPLAVLESSSLPLETPMAAVRDLEPPEIGTPEDEAEDIVPEREQDAAVARARFSARHLVAAGIVGIAGIAVALVVARGWSRHPTLDEIGAVTRAAAAAGAFPPSASLTTPAVAAPSNPTGNVPASPGTDRGIPPGMSLLTTAGNAPGHRIFVDGRSVGQTPTSVLVKCGTVKLRIGSSGHARTLDLPCGKETRVTGP